MQQIVVLTFNDPLDSRKPTNDPTLLSQRFWFTGHTPQQITQLPRSNMHTVISMKHKPGLILRMQDRQKLRLRNGFPVRLLRILLAWTTLIEQPAFEPRSRNGNERGATLDACSGWFFDQQPAAINTYMRNSHQTADFTARARPIIAE